MPKKIKIVKNTKKVEYHENTKKQKNTKNRKIQKIPKKKIESFSESLMINGQLYSCFPKSKKEIIKNLSCEYGQIKLRVRYGLSNLSKYL